jgi:uncharacterized protein (UPF0335 family)
MNDPLGVGPAPSRAPAHEGHNSVAAEQLRQYVTRIENLHEERKALGDDIRDVIQEAASAGFDKKAIKAVVAYRAKDRSDREAHDAIVQLYLSTLGDL